MIALRRTFAVSLALFFIIIFIPVLVLYRVNSTVANPGFYADQLRRADVYNFLYDDMLPAAIMEIRPGDDGQGVDISWAAPYLATMLRETLPPEWLQTQTEKTIYAFVPYFSGSRNNFVIHIVLKDRVEAGAAAVKNLLHKDDFTGRLYDEGTGYLVTAVTAETGGLPFPIDEATARSLVQRIVPVGWLVAQADNAISEITPYFIKDREHFVIRLDIASRLDDVRDVLVELLSRKESYDYFVSESLALALGDSLPVGLEIMPGVSVSREEITLAVGQVLSLDWYQRQVANLGEQVFAYLEGTQPDLEITVSLADRKPVLATVLAGLLDGKLARYHDSLPEATPEQAAAILSGVADTFPAYRLPGVSYTELKQLLGISPVSLISPVLGAAIPDELSFGEALASGDGENPLVQARDYIQDGFTFTDHDLAEKAGREQIENIRDTISSGFSFSDQDLRNFVTSDGGSDLEGLDQVRAMIKMVRQALLVFWILPLLLLVIIGLLGGRTWGSKLVWAVAVLAAASLIALIAVGPLFSALAQPRIDEALARLPAAPGSLETLAWGKAAAIAQNAISSFIGGVRLQATILLVVSSGLIVLGSLLHRRTVV
jgi:hypothetical protein